MSFANTGSLFFNSIMFLFSEVIGMAYCVHYQKTNDFFHYLCYIKRSLDNFKRYIFKLFNFVLVSIESVVDASD